MKLTRNCSRRVEKALESFPLENIPLENFMIRISFVGDITEEGLELIMKTKGRTICLCLRKKIKTTKTGAKQM